VKILIICNSVTGLERFRAMLIQELIKKGNVVSAIVPWSNGDKEAAAENRLRQMNCELKRISIERRGKNPFRDLKLLYEYYKAEKELEPDLVITYTIKPNIYGGIVSRVLKVPYAVNITGLGTAFQGNGLLKRLVTKMYKFALKKAKIVFFENVENREIFVNEGIVPKDKTCVLAGAGVDLDYFKYADYPQDEEETRFLFIGRVMHEKGIDELFNVMSRLYKEGYNCSLDVLGGFEENYTSIIKNYEKDGWLHYYGHQEDVRPFIERCHCFVLPSWHEGMANTNLESAATGRPVITSNIHGCLEAIECDKSGFLCERRNADSLYDCMKKFIMLSHKEKEEMGISGRKLMEMKFDKRIVVDNTIQKL